MSAPTWHRPAWSKPAWLLAALAAALVVCCPLPSTAFAEAPPTLNLSASDGPPGGDVGARVEGFGECVADIESSPSPEPDPDPPVVLRLVSIPALAAPAGTSGTVVLTWDGTPMTTVTVAAATAGLTLRVPADAGAGTHSVSAACAEDSKVFAERRFVVRPVAAPVPVPDLTSQTIPQATLTLREAGLSLGDVFGSGDEIVRQVPAAGTVAQPGSSVRVVLGGEPSLVRVPYVVGRTRHEAKVALRSAGLRPGSVTGTGNLVLGQSVTAGTAVPAGTTVTISVEVRPSSRVLVPRLIGLSLREASRELGDLGLVVGHTSG